MSVIIILGFVFGIPYVIYDMVGNFRAKATYGIKRTELKKFNSGMEWLRGENPKAYAKIMAMPKRNQFDAYNAYQKKLVLFEDDEEKHHPRKDSKPRYKNGRKRSSKKNKVYYED